MKNLVKKSVVVMLTVVTAFSIFMQPAMAAKKKDPRPKKPEIFYDFDHEKSVYQNFYSVDGDDRADNPTTRNLEKMLEVASLWARHAVKEFKKTPGEYWQAGLRLDYADVKIDRQSDMDINTAHAVLEFLQNSCKLDKKFDRVVKGKKVSDMEWEQMRKHLRKFDPYSVLCRASKAWHKNRKAELNPLEFAVLFEVLSDSTGYVEGGEPKRPEYFTKVVVGERKQNGNSKIDFRVEAFGFDGFMFGYLIDTEAVLRGDLSVISAFNETDPSNDYGRGLFKEQYQLKKFYNVKVFEF